VFREKGIPQYCEQPGIEVRAELKLSSLAPPAHQCFLDKIISTVPIVGKGERECPQTGSRTNETDLEVMLLTRAAVEDDRYKLC
jgi:hypothetical protein